MESDYVGNVIVIGIVVAVGYLFLFSRDGKRFFEQETKKLQQESTEALEKKKHTLERTRQQSVVFGVIAVGTLVAGNMFAFIKWLAPGYEFFEWAIALRVSQDDGGFFVYEWSIPAFIAVFSLYAFLSTSTIIKNIEHVLSVRRHRTSDQISAPTQ